MNKSLALALAIVSITQHLDLNSAVQGIPYDEPINPQPSDHRPDAREPIDMRAPAGEVRRDREDA